MYDFVNIDPSFFSFCFIPLNVQSMLIARSIDPEFRVRGSGIAKLSSNAKCMSHGMDQVMHSGGI